jgi:hypothetical protein
MTNDELQAAEAGTIVAAQVVGDEVDAVAAMAELVDNVADPNEDVSVEVDAIAETEVEVELEAEGEEEEQN